jgi:hypothetical protein
MGALALVLPLEFRAEIIEAHANSESQFTKGLAGVLWEVSAS